MRQQARKAKLYTINKLIRESRRLKSRNGPEEQKKKYHKKAERLMEEVLVLKVGISRHYSCEVPPFLAPSCLFNFADSSK